MNLTGRGPGRDKGEVHSGRISQNFNRLFRSVKLGAGTVVRWTALVTLVFLAVVSQSMARIVARLHSPMWAPPRLAAFNGILLVGASLVLGNTLVTLPVWKWTALPLVFAIGIFLVQMLYLHGLKVTNPTLSALLLSTSVPISIGVEYLWDGTPHSSWSAILAILYCGYVGILTLIDCRKAPSAESRKPGPMLVETETSTPI